MFPHKLPVQVILEEMAVQAGPVIPEETAAPADPVIPVATVVLADPVTLVATVVAAGRPIQTRIRVRVMPTGTGAVLVVASAMVTAMPMDLVAAMVKVTVWGETDL